jgi:PAS domain S-box-containing protein
MPLSRPANKVPGPLEPAGRDNPDGLASFLASLVQSSDDAIISKNLNGIITSWNRGAERLFGYAADEAVGKPVTMLIPPERQNEEVAILDRIKAGASVDHYETVRRRKDGTAVEISLTVSPIRSAEGSIIGASKIARDISERKRAQGHQHFLIRELQHRTQNLFSVIQFVVDRSLVEPRSLANAKEILKGRLQSLAHAHSILADAAQEGLALTEVMRRVLAGFSDQVSFAGCDLAVNIPAGQQFALTVHELATNAVKYRALSVPAGHVSIACNIERGSNDHSTFSFLWKESGGPPVVLPSRKGFGTTILLDAAKQFGRHVALNYEPDGLRYEVRFPLSMIEARTSEKAAPRR